MQMDDYLAALTSQIRSKKARGLIEQEIKAHLEDQIDAYEDQGLTNEQAVQKAVEQMGDPVAVGIELDRIHRPKAGGKIILMVLLLSIIGLAAQYFFYYRFSDSLAEHQPMYASPLHVFGRQCAFTLAGLMIMIILYLTDYSIIGKWAKQLGVCYLAGLALLCASPLLPVINGSHAYLKCILYLFVPIFGGILYRYKNTGMIGTWKCFLWMGAAFYVGIGFIGGGLGVTLDMTAICWLLLLTAIGKGWFAPSKKRALFFSAFLIPSAAAFWILLHPAPYQFARLQVIFQQLRPSYNQYSSGYTAFTARKIAAGLPLRGADWMTLLEQQQLPFQLLPDVSYDYIMLQIASIGGIAAAALLILMLAAFYLYLTRMIFRQKNQLGQVIGLGCLLVLVLETLRNLMNNFGFYTISTGGLPFFSYGRSHTIMVYGLLGILLSIYRYQNLAREPKTSRKPTEAGVLMKLGNYQLRLEKL